jgi:hypothetical protein
MTASYDYFVVGYGEADTRIAEYLHELGIDPEKVRAELRVGQSQKVLAYGVSFDTLIKVHAYAATNQWFNTHFYRRSHLTEIITTVPKTVFSQNRNHPAVREARKMFRDAVNRKVRAELKRRGIEP